MGNTLLILLRFSCNIRISICSDHISVGNRIKELFRVYGYHLGQFSGNEIAFFHKLYGPMNLGTGGLFFFDGLLSETKDSIQILIKARIAKPWNYILIIYFFLEPLIIFVMLQNNNIFSFSNLTSVMSIVN